ncbi:hypothetical protein L1887_32032 [Cichorium endivia]|nr:hypothetical protein L1887_32032 [Cichorium endivia]
MDATTSSATSNHTTNNLIFHKGRVHHCYAVRISDTQRHHPISHTHYSIFRLLPPVFTIATTAIANTNTSKP